jgi:phage terminase small subunit
MTTGKAPTLPKSLESEGRAFWRDVTTTFRLEPHELVTLKLACEALDVAAAARAELRAHGSVTVVDKYGQTRAHPACAVERDARSSYARCVALLKLPDIDGQRPRIGRPGRRF